MDSAIRHASSFMFLLIFTVFLCNASSISLNSEVNAIIRTKSEYLEQRKNVMDQEKRERIGRNIVLNEREEKVNQILMTMKQREFNNSRSGDTPFVPNMHFFQGKKLMENSGVFKIIQKMPKGGALHLHDCSMVDITWLVKNVTYRPNCYMCTKNGVINFHFYQKAPNNPGCPWQLVSAARAASGNVTEFDQKLYNSMSLVVDDPVKTYPNINVVWKVFLQVLDVANGLINYEPVFRDYIYEALKEFQMDNVQYLEVRALLPELYTLQGTTINNKTEVLNMYATTFDQFVSRNNGFVGAKVIYAGLRVVEESVIIPQIKQAMTFMTQFPKHFAGYDLVGQEDPGRPLLDYIDALLYPSQQNPPVHLPYFFHAGETDWEGTYTDDNLFDAVLLNTTRIGHGYAILKHPQVMHMIKQRNIALEVNPISNQVLMLVDDLRNHPGSVLIANGYPVVISADDPSVWGARGLSHDFYMAFMGLCGKDADLKMLKQLALNSLKYSAMSLEDKKHAVALWDYKWNQFINSILTEYSAFGLF